MPLRKRNTRIGPADIYYQVSGAGEPVVLVHGLSGSTRWWRYNVEALARHFQVYVIDLISFGRSRTGQRFVLRDAAASLTRWMERVGLERVRLVGHSMGGFIAADVAATFPDRVERLVLVDAAAIPMGRSYVAHVMGLARAVRRMPFDFFPVLFTDAYKAGPKAILRAAAELLATDISERLTQIRAPVLIVWGEHDTVVPLQIGERLHASLPGSRLVVVPEAGHNPMWDRPGVFNREAVAFLTADLASISPPTSPDA